MLRYAQHDKWGDTAETLEGSGQILRFAQDDNGRLVSGRVILFPMLFVSNILHQLHHL